MNECELVKIDMHGNDDGQLCVISDNCVHMDFKRIFYIYKVSKNSIRGKHSNCRTEFILIPLQGSCKIKVINVFGDEKIFNLNNPEVGLYIPKMIWKEMYDFSDDCILLALCSEYYDESEYERNLQTFLGKGGK